MTANEFAEAFDANARPLWCIVAGVIGRSDEVHDVLQDAAMIALSKLDQFDSSTSFLAWMGQIARYTALNHARRSSKSRANLVDPQVLSVRDAAMDRPAPEQVLRSDGGLVRGQNEFDDKVVAALESLDSTARACLLLRTVMDMPYNKIALALDIPEGTAMSHVHRARKAMRARLTDVSESGESRQGRRHD